MEKKREHFQEGRIHVLLLLLGDGVDLLGDGVDLLGDRVDPLGDGVDLLGDGVDPLVVGDSHHF